MNTVVHSFNLLIWGPPTGHEAVCSLLDLQSDFQVAAAPACTIILAIIVVA